MLVGLGLALLFALFLLLGRRKPTPIFVALGTLTGSYAAERLVSGWQHVGAGNGLSSVKLLQVGSYEFVEGVPFYLLVLGLLAAVYGGARLLVRSQFGLVLAGVRQNEERLAFFGYRVQLFKAAGLPAAGAGGGDSGAAVSLPPGLRRAGHNGAGRATTVGLARRL